MHALDDTVVGQRAGRQLVWRQDLYVRAADVPDLLDLHARPAHHETDVVRLTQLCIQTPPYDSVLMES